MTGKKIPTGLLAAFLLSARAWPGDVVVESESEADGAGAIVFDSEKIDFGKGEAVSIFDYDFGDSNVEFLAEGYWKSLVTAETAFTFGFGNTAQGSSPTMALTQEVDLSLYFMLNHHWYFEAAFADSFEKNTVAAGYVGDGTVKSARIANRLIEFPSDYSISELNRGIGGGDNQAPGFSINMAGDKWRADGAFRYDMLEAEEKSWYGKNTVDTDEISLSDWNCKNQFALPSSEIVSAVSEIYVEHSSGGYTDRAGRKYRKLDSTQYLLVASKSMVIISKDAKIGSGTAVAFKFNSEGRSALNAALETFLEETDEWFGSVDISGYTFFGSDTEGAFGEIDGESVLYVKHPAGFSPFACANRYDCGISGATDAAIASKNTETVSSLYAVEIADDDSALAENDFFYDSHLYADVYRTDSEGNGSDMAKAEIRFPLAKEHPEAYLGLPQKDDLILRVRTYTPVSRYDIGTDAVPGTVRVYKNGVLDSGAKYDPESGTIELSSSAGSGDRVYATWYTESEDSNTGALAGALGFEYRFTERLRSDLAFSARWTIPKEYADESYSSPGFLALSTGTKYENGGLSLSNAAAASFDSANTTGRYRILGMDDTESGTSYLSKTAAADLPDGFAPSLNTKDGQTELEEENNGSVDAENGIADSSISGYAVPVSWDFSANSQGSLFWAATAIGLSTSASALSSASVFQMAFRDSDDYADETFYLQLGVEATEEFNSIEEKSRVPTWRLSESDQVEITDAENGWKIAEIKLSDEDRSRISSLGKSNARIIVTSTSDGSGSIFVGPYEIKGISFQTSSDQNAKVSSFQTTDAALQSSTISSFNKSTNFVQEIDWKFSGDEESVLIEAKRYFERTDLSNYAEAAFYFKLELGDEISAEDFSYMEESDADFLQFKLDDSDGNNAVTISLSRDSAKKLSSAWHLLTIDLNEGSAEIDGAETEPGSCEVDGDAVPTRFSVALNPEFEADGEAFIYKSGKIYLDELHLSKANTSMAFEDKAKASYEKKGGIVEIGERVLLGDFSAKANADFSSTRNLGRKDNEAEAEIGGEAGISIAGVRMEAELSKTSGASGIKAASHKIKTEKQILSLLTFSEEYNFDSDGKTLSKTDQAKIGGGALSLTAKTAAESDSWAVKQTSSAEIAGSFKGTKLSAKASASQKISTTNDEGEAIPTEEYFSSWLESTKMQFDGGRENASKREIGAEAKAEHQFKKAKIKPGLAFSTKGSYKTSSSQTFSDSTGFSLAVPFAVKSSLFSLSWQKKAGETESVDEGGNYRDDAAELAKKLGEKDWFLKSIPIHDLLDSKISEHVYEKVEGQTETDFYSTAYTAEWKRQFRLSKYDFFIPNKAQASFERDIKASTSESDLYQAKIKTSSTAFNVFGKGGSLGIFDWFRQDEYATSLSVAAKIPRKNPQNTSVVVNAYTQATFYMGDSDFLKTGVELSIEGRDDWSGKTTAVWKRNGNSRLMEGIIGIIRPSFDTKKIVHTRTDSLNIALSCASSSSSASNTRKYGVSYSHTLDSKITNYVTINTSLAADYSATWNKIATITATLGLGCTVKF